MALVEYPYGLIRLPHFYRIDCRLVGTPCRPALPHEAGGAESIGSLSVPREVQPPGGLFFGCTKLRAQQYRVQEWAGREQLVAP